MSTFQNFKNETAVILGNKKHTGNKKKLKKRKYKKKNQLIKIKVKGIKIY